MQKISCENSTVERLSCVNTKVVKANLRKVVLWKYNPWEKSCGIDITEVTKGIFGHVSKFRSSSYEMNNLATDG